LEKIQSSLISETLDVENNDFVELLMFSKNDGVLMTGKMTDANQDSVMNQLHIIHVYQYTYDIVIVLLAYSCEFKKILNVYAFYFKFNIKYILHTRFKKDINGSISALYYFTHYYKR